MAEDTYFDDYFNAATGDIEIGTCSCDPSHSVFATLRFPREILVSCEELRPIRWSEVTLVEELRNQIHEARRGNVRKKDLSALLRLLSAGYQADLASSPAAISILVPTTGPDPVTQEPVDISPEVDEFTDPLGDLASDLDNHSGQEDEDGVVEDPQDSESVSGDEEVETVTDQTHDLALSSTTNASATASATASGVDAFLPIFFYDSDDKKVTLFNMVHISRTTLLYAGAIALIDARALFSAFQRRDGPAMWGVLLDTFGTLLPPPLLGAARNLQEAMGVAVTAQAVPEPERYLLQAPASITSNAAQRLQAAAARDVVPCGEGSRRVSGGGSDSLLRGQRIGKTKEQGGFDNETVGQDSLMGKGGNRGSGGKGKANKKDKDS